MNKSILEKLNELEQNRTVTLGINRSATNNYWVHNSLIGRILNLVTYLGIIMPIYYFIKDEFYIAIFVFLMTGIYVYLIQKVTTHWIRLKALHDISLFEKLYALRLLTIRINNTNDIISTPYDWKLAVSEIA